jgi:hypothetical protein
VPSAICTVVPDSSHQIYLLDWPGRSETNPGPGQHTYRYCGHNGSGPMQFADMVLFKGRPCVKQWGVWTRELRLYSDDNSNGWVPNVNQ